MALKTNFTDDILAESMNGKRQYNVTDNSNGTKSLEDVTDYQSVGSTFSAKDMNETNASVNQAYDDMGDEFNKDTKYLAGSVKIHNNKLWKFKVDHDPGEFDESQVEKTTLLGEIGELTENFGGLSFGVDGDGNYGYYGADGSLVPFSTVKNSTILLNGGSITYQKVYTFDITKGSAIIFSEYSSGGTYATFKLNNIDVTDLIYENKVTVGGNSYCYFRNLAFLVKKGDVLTITQSSTSSIIGTVGWYWNALLI